jgi:hypothetical protein
MSITAPTPAQLHDIAEHALATPDKLPADAAQAHDIGEEAEPAFQAGIVALAQRCSECGQPLPEVEP